MKELALAWPRLTGASYAMILPLSFAPLPNKARSNPSASDRLYIVYLLLRQPSLFSPSYSRKWQALSASLSDARIQRKILNVYSALETAARSHSYTAAKIPPDSSFSQDRACRIIAGAAPKFYTEVGSTTKLLSKLCGHAPIFHFPSSWIGEPRHIVICVGNGMSL